MCEPLAKNRISSFRFLPGSTAYDEMINSEKAVEVGTVMQTKLDDQIPPNPIETKNEVKLLSFLRGGSNVHSATRINALKYINHLRSTREFGARYYTAVFIVVIDE